MPPETRSAAEIREFYDYRRAARAVELAGGTALEVPPPPTADAT